MVKDEVGKREGRELEGGMRDDDVLKYEDRSTFQIFIELEVKSVEVELGNLMPLRSWFDVS